MRNKTDIFDDLDKARRKMCSSFLYFVRVMYKLKNDRDFLISAPPGRESHFITLDRELKDVFLLKQTRLIINIPPGHGKSTMLVYWVAWCMAIYPDCQFLYISYGYEVAEKHTTTIKEIMQMPAYKKLFNVHLREDSQSKGSFRTTAGGCVKAFGSSGAVTGQDAGLPNLSRFSGGWIIDDAHKPDQCHSDTMREAVIRNYNETIKGRARGENVARICIGQRLHEYDLPGYLISGADGNEWKKVILKSIDAAGNPLYPENYPLSMLKIEQRYNEYVFAAQHQQCPLPAGGGIFKEDNFLILDEEPEIISTFITCDTAETDKSYNDATVFSFFGLYNIKRKGVDLKTDGLHWIDCREIRVEPRDLENEFFDFYASCMRYKVKPTICAVEKKSTGVTLLSTLKATPGIRTLQIDRTSASSSKTTRFLSIQPIVAKKMITFSYGARHAKMCIDHMTKITANMSHRHDDIADTLYDAVKLALMDKILYNHMEDHDPMVSIINSNLTQDRFIRGIK